MAFHPCIQQTFMECWCWGPGAKIRKTNPCPQRVSPGRRRDWRVKHRTNHLLRVLRVNLGVWDFNIEAFHYDWCGSGASLVAQWPSLCAPNAEPSLDLWLGN